VEPSDDDLLARTRHEPSAFGVFYARHERAVFRYHLRRVRDVELAADLCAETFAGALLSSRRYRPGPQPAVAWLFGIARNVLGRSLERGRVESRARRRLGMPPLEVDDGTVEVLARLHAGQRLGDALGHLPEHERAAVLARVVEEHEYPQIAADLKVSEAVVRKRVSRGLARMKEHLG
jgi:RNA polymerase sigma-70 factor (ECF subfamily)